MSAGAYAPVWRRFMHKTTPFLFRRCNAGNFHWRWDTWCFCSVGCHIYGGERPWHGGIEHLPTGREYHYEPDAAKGKI